MKKTKLLALTLVAAIMMMGAGYAYWTDTLVITNTVKAGELDVVFKEPANIINEGEYQPNADCSVLENGQGMNVTFLEVYPGLKNTFEFTLENNGTLGAYVDDFAVSSTWGKDIIDQITCDEIKIDNQITDYNGKTLKQAMRYLNGLGNGDGIFVDTLLAENGDQYRYTPEEVLVTLEIGINKNADKETLPEKGKFGFNIDANVYQFNGR